MHRGIHAVILSSQSLHSWAVCWQCCPESLNYLQYCHTTNKPHKKLSWFQLNILTLFVSLTSCDWIFSVYKTRMLVNPHALILGFVCMALSPQLDHGQRYSCLQISFPLQIIKRIQQHALEKQSIVHFSLVLLKLDTNSAWSVGVEERWENNTLSHCCKKHWNVAGIWLQWWPVALVTGRGFRWRLMQTWWQKAKSRLCVWARDSMSGKDGSDH